MVLATDNLIRKLNDEYGLDEAGNSNEDLEYLSDPAVFDLSLEEAFLKSQLEVAKTDSISLAVNLKDTTVSLLLDGIQIHKAKISRYKVSRFFNSIDRQTFINILAAPVHVRSYKGSIAREPVFYIKAPKDTVEAAKKFFSPDTSQVIPAYVRIEMSSRFTLRIMQEETRSVRDFAGRIFFGFKERLFQLTENLNNIFSGELPEYSPVITITIPRRDVINIYRALPDNARVCIKYAVKPHLKK
jgi:hypothetical protein